MAVPDFKAIFDHVKNGATVDAQNKIMELYNLMLAIQSESIVLRARVAELESLLNTQKKLEFRKPFYFQKDDDQPYCPLCWENDSKLLHLFGPYNGLDGEHYRCINCKNSYKINYLHSPSTGVSG